MSVGTRMVSGRWTRREFVARSVLLAASVGVAGGLGQGRARAATTYDYTARSTYEEFGQVFDEGGHFGEPTDLNDVWSAPLAWGQSEELLSFIRMYEAYKDPAYLDRLIHNADLVLASRDSERGVTDYRGLSLPAWRAGANFTVRTATVKDSSGRPSLEIRSALTWQLRPADQITATVSAGSRPGTFRLTVASGPMFQRTDTFDNLTMDPTSPDYAVRRVYDGYDANSARVTVKDVRPMPDADSTPVAGSVTLAANFVLFAVHTGMITYPMAAFVRIVHETPELRADPKYRGKAASYLSAVEAAVAVHDREWGEDEAGQGYYGGPKGMPVAPDGVVAPLNQFLGLGRVQIELAAVTGNRVYRDRIQKMAVSLKNQLVRAENGAYVWPYFPTFSQAYIGWSKTGSPDTDVSDYMPAANGQRQIEDVSHALEDILYAVLAFRDHIGPFDGLDMTRLAATYTRNIMTTAADGTPSVSPNVDGSGGAATFNQLLYSAEWIPLAWWDSRIFEHSRAIYDSLQVQPGGSLGMDGVAHLNWFTRRARG